MKESIGNTMLFNIVLTFVIVFIGLFVTSITYSKGYKVKNRMIEILEKTHSTCGNDQDLCNRQMMSKIESELDTIGYRIVNNSNNSKCSRDLKLDSLKNNKYDVKVQYSKKYQVCFAYINPNDSNHIYYVVNAYMYLDLPIIGDRLQIPVRGQTKTFIPKLTS